jgi:hypothetical protein
MSETEANCRHCELQTLLNTDLYYTSNIQLSDASLLTWELDHGMIAQF